MPTIFELFGFSIDDRSTLAESTRKARQCPFMQEICDGGGNRYQTEIPLKPTEPLTNYFNSGIKSVVPGVCSILAGQDIWIVCPRRLFAARYNGSGFPPINLALQDYERSLLINAGLPQGVDLGFWPEVTLHQTLSNAVINYHFDYVAAPLVRISLRDYLQQLGLSKTQVSQELNSLVTVARKNGYFPKRKRDVADIPTLFPDISHPYILEVMTASTSGSDTERSTDMRNAFRRAILNNDHVSPGINKRQVWGRMVTQLFAKTALAREWEGRTIWIIQDELLRNIELTTRLRTSDMDDNLEQNISLVVMQYKVRDRGRIKMSFKAAIDGDAGVNFGGNDAFTDILLPKSTPHKVELLRAILRRKIGGILNL